MMKRICFFALTVVMVLSLCSCGTVDKPCDWCEKSPSKEYTTSSGKKSYVCKECSSTCMICDKKKATTHCTNMLDMELFVCADCYKEMKED